MYATRLTEANKKELTELWQSFLGTKKYHNYTKDIKATEMAAMRYMMELTADSFVYVNQHSCEISTSSDPDAIELVHFHLKG